MGERENLGFAYRHSRLQNERRNRGDRCSELETGDPVELGKQRDEILDLRRQKHPDWRKQPTAGSFFKNIEPTSAAERRQAAGWFLEQAGAKSMRVGGARVFEKHANIIVTEGDCRAQDVLDLSRQMAAAVKAKFGFDLAPRYACWAGLSDFFQALEERPTLHSRRNLAPEPTGAGRGRGGERASETLGHLTFIEDVIVSIQQAPVAGRFF